MPPAAERSSTQAVAVAAVEPPQQQPQLQALDFWPLSRPLPLKVAAVAAAPVAAVAAAVAPVAVERRQLETWREERRAR